MDEGNYDNRIEEKKPSINLQKSLNNQKRDRFRKNAQKKEYTTISSIPQTNLPSSYNDLHEIVSQSKSIEELPLPYQPERIAFQKNIQEGQQYSGNQNTLLNNMNPSQFDNSMHKAITQSFQVIEITLSP